MKKYILVIDNEQLLCQGLKRTFNREKVRIDTAATVGDAITRHNACNYDLCLLEIRLSDEKCLELIEAIREQWPEMKIILMTTCDVSPHEEINEYILNAERNGAGPLLCKPFDLQHFKNIVAHGLNEGPNRPEATGLFA